MTANKATAGMRITASWLNLNIPGDWQSITPMNGWANAGSGLATFKARLANSVTVELVGILTPGTLTNGTIIGTLPAGMSPSSSQNMVAQVTGGTGAGTAITLFCTSTGNVEIFNCPAGATQVSVSSFYSLDA